MNRIPYIGSEDEQVIPTRMGPWRHLMLVTQDLNMSLTALYKLIESN